MPARLCLAAVAFTLSIGGVAPATAATFDRGLTRITSPKSALARSGPVTVRVHTPAGAELIAHTGGRTITRRFNGGGSVRTARLRVGKELRRGPNQVHVETTSGGNEDFDTVEVVAGRRDRGLFKLSGVPGRVSHRIPVVKARWRHLPRHVSARLNGHSVRADLFSGTGEPKPAHLGADDGLDFGQNHLVVTAYDDKGRYDRESYEFHMSRRAPLVGAGDDVRSTVGRPLVVDGSESAATRAGRDLAYRWTIKNAPKGSTAQLSDPESAHPNLVPDVNGSYQLRLKVSEGAKGLEAADTITVDGSPPTPPIGRSIDTIPGSGKSGVRVDGQVQSTSTNWVQMVQMNRGTGTLTSTDYGSGDSQKLKRDVNALVEASAKPLVILTGGGRPLPIQKSQTQALDAVYKDLGGTLDPEPAFGSGDWSLIGVPGMPEGQAYQNSQLRTGQFQVNGIPEAPRPGNLHGYLQKDDQDNFAFAFGDYVPFDTNSENFASTHNTITIGGQSFDSGPNLVADGQFAFQVVVADQGTLEPLENKRFIVNDSIGQPAAERAMADLIKGYVDRKANVVFLIQSIGAPWISDNTWAHELASAIQSAGGTATLFNSLTDPATSRGYVLVGGTNDRDGAQELANVPENPSQTVPAKLSGAFIRNRQSQFYPAFASPRDYLDVSGSLWEIAYQAPQPWPFSGADEQGERAAMTDIARQLDLGEPYLGDLRLIYWAEDISSTSIPNEIDNATQVFFRGEAECGCTADEFKTVLQEIQQEIDWVVNIDGYLYSNVSPAITQSEIINNLSLTQVAGKIEHAVGASGGANTEAHVFGILAQATRLAGLLGPGVPGAGVFASIGGIFGVASQVANAPAGNSLVEAVQTKASNLGALIDYDYQNALLKLDHPRNLLVSDYGKLKAAGPLAGAPASSGGWKPDGQLSPVVVNGLEGAAIQSFYEQLMPTGYEIYELTYGGTYDTGGQSPNSYKCDSDKQAGATGSANFVIYPWEGIPSSAWHDQIVGVKGVADFDKQPHALSSGVGVNGPDDDEINGGGDLPGGSLTDPLFRPLSNPLLSSGGIGFTKQQFFERFRHQRVHC